MRDKGREEATGRGAESRQVESEQNGPMAVLQTFPVSPPDIVNLFLKQNTSPARNDTIGKAQSFSFNL